MISNMVTIPSDQIGDCSTSSGWIIVLRGDIGETILFFCQLKILIQVNNVSEVEIPRTRKNN